MRLRILPPALLCAALASASPGAARDLSKESDATLLAELGKIRAELKRRGSKEAPAPARAALASRPPAGQVYADVVDPGFTPALLEEKYKARTQDLFVRSDPIDGFRYLYPLSTGDGKGATLSYNNNLLNDTQALTIKGFGSFIAAREFLETADRPLEGPPRLSGYALAPFVYADGTLNVPRRASERSALQAGFDAQFEVYGGGILSLQNFGVRPFYQTDFRGEGSIYGAAFAWEPYQLDLNLGARRDVAEPKVLGVTWRAVAEANVFRVDDPGLSAFGPRREYAFLGGTLQARTILFENYPDVPSFLCGRIYANGSLAQFWNVADRGKSFHDLELEAGYILSPDVTPSNRFCAGDGAADAPRPETGRLKTSVSFVYNNGTNRFTMEKREQYKVQLSIQY